MSAGSSADLLFRIGADSSDAAGVLQNFRSLLSNNLGQMKAEFAGWSNSVLSYLSAFKGGAGGIAAAVAALDIGAFAAGKALYSAARHAAEYAEQIDDANDVTGISVEELSKLRYSAQTAGVEFPKLQQGLVLFASAIEAARRGSEQQVQAFQRMGIARKEVEEGSRDMLPLLYRVSDAFRDNANTVEKAAIARQIFGRGGAEFLEFLSRGSAGIREMNAEAERLGLVLSEADVRAAKALRLEMDYLKAAVEGVTLRIGTFFVPALTGAAVLMEAAWETVRKGSLTWAEFSAEVALAFDRLERRVATAMPKLGERAFAPPEFKQTLQEFQGFSTILDQVRGRIASLAGEDAELIYSFQRMSAEIEEAGRKFAKLQKEGKLAPESLKSEMAAMMALPGQMVALAKAQAAAMQEQRDAAVLGATEQLEERMVGLREQTFENQRKAAAREIALLIWKHKQEETYSEENAYLIEQIRSAMSERINREQTAAFAEELRRLQQGLAEMVTARMTSAERIRWVYDQDLERFSQVEEAKTLALAQNEQERDVIRQQYDLNRQAALRRYGEDLNSLQNSRGWQGVFGDFFAASIRGNEELLREWSTSSNQGMLMSKVTMEALGDTGRKAFGMMAQGMGQSIAQAIVYRKSIGEAMRQAATETLAAIAAESMVRAIYATGLGFMYLALQKYDSAAKAFTAAAVFGSIGVAAAVAGRAIAPRQAGAGEAAGASEGVRGRQAETGASSAQERQPRVSITVNGHVIGRAGVEELAEMINEAVKDRDVRLIATQVKQSGRVAP